MRPLPTPSEGLLRKAQTFGSASGAAAAKRDPDGVIKVREKFRAWLRSLKGTQELKDELDSAFARSHRIASGQMV